MSKRIRPFNLICSGTELKKCKNKSKCETSIQLAFINAKKSGWTSEVITEKFTKYYCPACSHKRKNILDIAS